MAGHDAEIELLRNRVTCAALLERLPPPWHLDRKESTRRALKYRRGEGEIIIVNHDGRGWWDAGGSAKGDIFDLVQFLDPALNFGQVRQVLRRFVGIAPTFPEALREHKGVAPDRPLPQRWNVRPRLRPGSPAWRYLTGQRCLPEDVLAAATVQDVVREGYYGSAWFAHRDGGAVSHIEVRGPDYKGSLAGGRKTLFRFGGAGEEWHRLALTEAPIDALSLATIESTRFDTLYAATGGGMGPVTLDAIRALLSRLAAHPGALLASATDANAAGDRYAACHAELAAATGVAFERLRPAAGIDWNDVIRKGRGL